MYLSYLLGGKVDFGDLKMSWNGNRIQRKDLECVSWNLEPACESYRKNIETKNFVFCFNGYCIRNFL